MQNPILLNGLDFIEYVSSEPDKLEQLFLTLGLIKTAKHKNKDVSLFQIGDCNFVINNTKNSFAEEFSKKHNGPAVSALGFRLKSSAGDALDFTKAQGAKSPSEDPLSHTFKAIYGVGDSLIYFVENDNHWKNDFEFIAKPPEHPHFLTIDHLTNNVPVGDMQLWCDFYEKMFGFTERRFFDIKGLKTGLNSKVMRSPCNTITIPINEPSDDEMGKKSQIQEYIEVYNGAGIQHIAFETSDIISIVSQLKTKGMKFLDVPDTYYDTVKERVPCLEEDLKDLQANKILADGDEKNYLLQIFTENVIGPIFYEVIQRKGHDGFGEGNFQALFDAIERDQIKRGYLK